MASDPAFDDLQKAIGYRFDDTELLTTAVTHSSFASENGVESYERLEFLGDAVLELAVTERIFMTLGSAPEGRMTRIRASVVDETTLASIASDIGIPDAIRLGIGEDRNGGRARSSIRSDVVEALLGAVFVDGGPDAANAVVHHLLDTVIEDRMAAPRIVDPRSDLQELLAREGRTVTFDFQRSGPDHAVRYEATAVVEGEVVGVGSGASKKAAAIDAARNALASDTGSRSR